MKGEIQGRWDHLFREPFVPRFLAVVGPPKGPYLSCCHSCRSLRGRQKEWRHSLTNGEAQEKISGSNSGASKRWCRSGNPRWRHIEPHILHSFGLATQSFTTRLSFRLMVNFTRATHTSYCRRLSLSGTVCLCRCCFLFWGMCLRQASLIFILRQPRVLCTSDQW